MNVESRLKRAGLIISLGLLVQLLSLLPIHPLAFIAFVGAGVPIMTFGVVLFLLAIVSSSAESR